jgi:hypothetical protein
VSRARKQDRFGSTLAVSYREPTSSEPSLGACVDISPSGMFIETARPAARGVLVRFECVSQGNQGVVRGTARVMWLRPHNEAQGKAGMGVRFVRLEPGSARAIEELIAHANTSGARTKSDGPEARSVTEEPSVVLTAERTIGPSNRSSSVPAKGLRAPTLRGMYPTDLRSSSPPPPSSERTPDPAPQREAPASASDPTPSAAPAVSGPAPNDDRKELDTRSSRPPSDKAVAHSQALRDRGKRGDETPTRATAGAPGDDRITAPDGSAIDPWREKQPPMPNKGLGSTMHDASGAQPHKLSASGARRGSDNTLGVPSPPPPPWKARHSERPPGPGGVEVIRAVHVTAEAQAAAAAAAASSTGGSGAQGANGTARPQQQVEVVAELSSPNELPGAQDPPLSDWEPTISPSRPAMRPDRTPPHISVPYALPASTEELQPKKPGRNWMPWIIVGSGVVATLVINSQFGRPVAGVPVEDGAETTANEPPVDDSPLAPENQFLPQKEVAEPDPLSITPQQVIVQLHVEPLGAKASALGQTATSPGKLSFPYEAIEWPLRVRVEMAGFGSTEMALPKQVFARDEDRIVHELYVTLQPVAAAGARPELATPVEPAAQPKPDGRKPHASTSRPPRTPKPEAPVIGGTPPPGTTQPEPPPQPPAPVASSSSPFERALECLSRGDNACVLSTLASASGARELDLLIETHRATGDASSAEAAMRRYLELHPDGRRASQYRRALGVAP